VRRVSDLIGEITASSSEQRDGINQVNQAVSNLDQMTQQNAALVEQSSAAVMALQEQAGRLSQVVSVFRTGQQPAQARPAAPRLAPAAAQAAAPAAKPAPAVQRPQPRAVAATPAKPSAAPAALAGQGKPARVADDDWETF
jgi:hypothetical protein